MIRGRTNTLFPQPERDPQSPALYTDVPRAQKVLNGPHRSPIPQPFHNQQKPHTLPDKPKTRLYAFSGQSAALCPHLRQIAHFPLNTYGVFFEPLPSPLGSLRRSFSTGSPSARHRRKRKSGEQPPYTNLQQRFPPDASAAAFTALGSSFGGLGSFLLVAHHLIIQGFRFFERLLQHTIMRRRGGG